MSAVILSHMSLRVLSHGWAAGSYEDQFQARVWNTPLDDLNHDLRCQSAGMFDTTRCIASTLSRDALCQYAKRVSSHLDGNVHQKTADECRTAYNIMTRCEADIEELRVIYEHLREYYKSSRRPMPLRT